MNIFMQIAVKEAVLGLKKNHGGPFGAVIVMNNNIIAKAHNMVIKTNDPTAHAEITAIRKAVKKLKKFDLSDCIIYSTAEPCPMCLSAIFWARIKTLYYGCTKEDCEKIGFDDNKFYDILLNKSNEKIISIFNIDRNECLMPFKMWENKNNKIQY